MTPEEARRIVRTLRQGTVSPETVSAVSIGTTTIRKTLSNELKKFQISGSDGQPIVIKGEWGSGKSHISLLCQTILDENQFAWTRQSIDAKGNSLAHLNRCIATWMGQLRIGGVLGFRRAIAEGRIDFNSALEWSRRQSSSFANGLWGGLNGSEWGYLRMLGQDCCSPDNARQHERALGLFLEGARFLWEATGVRTVLLLDEIENIAREWDIRGRRSAYRALGDLVGSKSIKVILFVTDRFAEMVENDLDRARYEDYWTESAKGFLRKSYAADALRVRPLTTEDATSLVNRVREIYSTALGRQVHGADADQVRAAWSRTATRSTRLLVRLAIHDMDVCTT